MTSHESIPLDPNNNVTSTANQTYIKLVNTKKPCKCISSSKRPEDIIAFLKDAWNLENPKLILSVTGGASNIALRHEVKKIFKEGLIKAAKSTGAWIISGGTDYGVMRLVGDAVNEGIKTENLAVLGIATKCKVTTSKHNEALLINNGEIKLNPYHSHFILVSEGISTEWCQEIAFRSRLEEMLIGNDGQMVLIVVGGGKGTFQTVYETLQKGHPVLLLEVCDHQTVYSFGFGLLNYFHDFKKSGGCADVLIKICSDKNIEIGDVLKDITLNDQELRDSIRYCENIKQIYNENADLINILGMNNNEDIEHTTLEALKNKKRNNRNSRNLQQINEFEPIKLAFNWNAVDYFTKTLTDYKGTVKELKHLFYTAIIENKPTFVEIMLDKFDIEQFFSEGDLERLYDLIWNEKKKLPFVFLMGNYIVPDISDTASIELKISDILHKLMGSYFEIKDKLLQDESTIQKLFIFSVLFNRYEISFIFWKRGDNQIANALFASQFLLKLSGQYRGDNQELLKYSKKFEDAAIETMKIVDDHTHYFINYCTLFRNVDFYETSPLEMAIICNRRRFVAQASVQSILDDIWYGMVEKYDFIDLGFLKFVLAICSFGILAPLLYSRDQVLRKVEGSMEQREGYFFYSQKYKNNYFKQIVTQLDNEMEQKEKKEKEEKEKQEKERQNKKSITRKPICNLTCKEYFLSCQTFMTTPVVQSTYSLIYFLVFLGLFSKFLISDFPLSKSQFLSSYKVFIALNVIVFSLLVEEIHQLVNPVFRKKVPRGYFKIFKTWLNALKFYYEDRWNITDNLGIFTFIIADILFLSSIFYSDQVIILRVSKFLFCLDFTFWAFKALHFCALDQHLGPKLKILERIIKTDMRFFIIVIGVISLTFGVISHTALMNTSMNDEVKNLTYSSNASKSNESSTTQERGGNSTNIWTILQNIIHNAYWPIFGELRIYEGIECSSTSKCPDPYTRWHIFVFLMLMLYALAILVLINLLIAMFNSTFEKIHKRTDIIWKFQRFYLIFGYYKYSSAPPPLNLIHRFIMCFQKNKKDLPQTIEDYKVSYIQFERQCAHECLNRLTDSNEIDEDSFLDV